MDKGNEREEVIFRFICPSLCSGALRKLLSLQFSWTPNCNSSYFAIIFYLCFDRIRYLQPSLSPQFSWTPYEDCLLAEIEARPWTFDELPDPFAALPLLKAPRPAKIHAPASTAGNPRYPPDPQNQFDIIYDISTFGNSCARISVGCSARVVI